MRRIALLSCLALLGFAPAAGAAPSDPFFAQQWGPQQVRAPQAWSKSKGLGTTIGIVDSGVDFGHPDLKSKLLTGATFLDCGSSSCGNGGWESGPAARRASKSTHGTHVAGIAAAGTDDGIGIAGVAPAAKLLPVKVLDEEGGSFEDIARGIRYDPSYGYGIVDAAAAVAAG